MEAEFYLVFAPDTARNAQAIDAKFIKGDESLKPLATQLKTVKYQLVFPDNFTDEDSSTRSAALLAKARRLHFHDGESGSGKVSGLDPGLHNIRFFLKLDVSAFVHVEHIALLLIFFAAMCRYQHAVAICSDVNDSKR